MISGLSPKDFCSIFSETCCCVEQRGTAEEGWQRGDVPLSPPSDILSTLSSFIHVFSAMKHRDLQEWKLFEGGEEADRPPTREEMSSDMAGERMEDGQAYFTPVCSDHFVLLVHLFKNCACTDHSKAFSFVAAKRSKGRQLYLRDFQGPVALSNNQLYISLIDLTYL